MPSQGANTGLNPVGDTDSINSVFKGGEAKMADIKIGKVVHFYDKILVAVVNLTAPLKTGDTIKFKHGDDEFTQTVESMQVDHQPVESVKKGDEVAIKVNQPIKGKAEVYTV